MGSVWVDNSGYVYTTDHQEHLIWRLKPATTINVKHINTVANGTNFQVGYSTFGGTPITKDFTIENTGSKTMFVESITAGSYSIQGNPAKEIAPGGSTTFTVAMDVTSVGTKNETLSILTNDVTNGTYNISLQGMTFKASQTITFGALTTKTFGDATFNLTATGGASGNAITYVSSDTNVATISGNTVTIVGVGITTITASQTGSTNYNAATDVPQTLTVNKAAQTITFDLGANATKIVGAAAFDLTATGGASGNVITYTSSNTAVATISGKTVTIVGAGTTTITASQAGNTNYNAATDVTQTLTVTQPTGLAENLANAQLTLFPNPTPDVVHFRIKGKVSNAEVQTTVLDQQGAVVLQNTQRLVNGTMSLPINNLATGYYLFKIKIGEETILRRIVKK